MIQINRNYIHNDCHRICNLITPLNIGIHICRIIYFAHYWVSHILHSVLQIIQLQFTFLWIPMPDILGFQHLRKNI